MRLYDIRSKLKCDVVALATAQWRLGLSWRQQKNEIEKMGARARVSLAFDTREEVRDHIGTEWNEDGEEKNSGLLRQ